jgi:hypothetical protein
VARLEEHLGDRLYVLTAPSLEEYLPDTVYEVGGEDKGAVLAEIAACGGDFTKESAVKARVSRNIAASLTARDLDSVTVLRDAVRRAIALAY